MSMSPPHNQGSKTVGSGHQPMDATGCSWGWSSLSPCPDLVLVYSFLKNKSDLCFRPLCSSCLVPLVGCCVVSVGSVWSLPSITLLLGSCESDLQNRCSLSFAAVPFPCPLTFCCLTHDLSGLDIPCPCHQMVMIPAASLRWLVF